MIIKEIDNTNKKFEEAKEILKELSEIKLPKNYIFEVNDWSHIHLYLKEIFFFEYRIVFIFRREKGMYFVFEKREDYEKIKSYLNDSKLNITVEIENSY